MIRVLFAAALTAWLFLFADAAHASWLRAESPNFIVFGQGSENRLRERTQQLEEFDGVLRRLTRGDSEPAPVKLTVYLVNGARPIQAIRTVPQGVAGLYTVSDQGMAAFVDSTAAQGNVVLFHEYAHHFMARSSAMALPSWYIEGFADYFATTRFQGDNVDLGDVERGRAAALLQGRWLPMDTILGDRALSLPRAEIGQFYAQSWLLTHYFYSNGERLAALNRYLAALPTAGWRAALQSATGFTPETLTRELRRYLSGNEVRFRRMPRAVVPATSVAITRLPASANDLLLLDAHLRAGVGDEYRADFLQRLRTAAARHSADDYAKAVLARAEAIYGDAGTAERLLAPLLAAQPNDVDLLYAKGMRYLRLAEDGVDSDANVRQARTAFGRAHAVDPDHWQTLYRYAQVLRGRPEFLTENTSNVLLLAVQLAPQVPELRMNAAFQLLARGERRAAANLVRSLAAHPHNKGLADAAQRIVEQAESGAATAAAAP